MKNYKNFLVVFIVAILIRSSFFIFSSHYAPNAKMLIDSERYITTAGFIASDGVFAREKIAEQRFVFEDFRTPGYPVFLALFHNYLKISFNGIILIQNFLTFLTAFFLYKSAELIDRRLCFLSVVIILFDPNILVHNFLILTESLFLLLISIFMYIFMRYVGSRSMKMLILSALLAAASVYVRPIGYYLGAGMAFYLILIGLNKDWKRNLLHVCVFILIVYGLLGTWQLRNKHHFGRPFFSSITENVVPEQGIYKSYARNADPLSKNLSPLPYYLNVTSRCVLSFLTRPVSFKYFNNKILTVGGKVISYPWIIFWLGGLIIGLTKFKNRQYLLFFIFMITYFTGISVAGGMWGIGSRFRIAIMPFVAIVSAYGWIWLMDLKKEKKKRYWTKNNHSS